MKGRERRLAEEKDGAYRERDQLVAALSKIYPAWLERHPKEDEAWEDEWRWIVFVEIPTKDGRPGQLSWHIHDSELSYFDNLERRQGNSWDGHTTEEKYERLRLIKPHKG